MTARPKENPLALFEIDYSNGLPVWIQIKNRIVYLIGSGEFRAGDRLPTVRSLAVDLDISYNTVNRAYMDLERDGFVSTRRGRGTFVAMRPSEMESSESEAVELLADEMIRAGLQMGMSSDDILKMVRARLKHRSQ